MKKTLTFVVMLAFTTLSTNAIAGEVKVIGVVTAIKIVSGGADAVLKDSPDRCFDYAAGS